MFVRRASFLTILWAFTLLNPSVQAEFIPIVLAESSQTYPAGSTFQGFTSQTADPLGPFSGSSVQFEGWEEPGGSSETLNGSFLVYRYRLDFNDPVQITEIELGGAAFNGANSAFRLLAADLAVVSSFPTSGGNSPQSFTFPITDSPIGTTFYVDEYDNSSTWRYRDHLGVGFTVVPEPASVWPVCCLLLGLLKLRVHE